MRHSQARARDSIKRTHINESFQGKTELYAIPYIYTYCVCRGSGTVNLYMIVYVRVYTNTTNETIRENDRVESHDFEGRNPFLLYSSLFPFRQTQIYRNASFLFSKYRALTLVDDKEIPSLVDFSIPYLFLLSNLRHPFVLLNLSVTKMS